MAARLHFGYTGKLLALVEYRIEGAWKSKRQENPVKDESSKSIICKKYYRESLLPVFCSVSEVLEYFDET